VMRAVSAAGGPLVLAAVTLAAGGLLGLLRRSLGPVLLAGVAVAGTGGLTIMFKEALGRGRPPLNDALAAADGHAFPSAHAATAAAVFGILAYLYAARLRSWSARVGVWVAAAMLTALVGISRVYLGVHWTTDVIGGWAVGVLWLAVVVIGWTIVIRHRQPGIPEHGGRGDRDPGPSLPGGSALETGARVPGLSGGRRAGRCDGSTA
jgi:membrane-associated phospholipid phosphatase